MSSAQLNVLPQRLARLLIQAKDSTLAAKVDRYLERHSDGAYSHIHHWLDADGDVGRRCTLGRAVCEAIETENFAALDD